jgi:hypothetical protein
MISAIASIGNFISSHKTTPRSIEFNILIKKNTLQMSFDSLDDTKIEKKFTKETVENAEESCLVNKELSNLRDENIRLGNTELQKRFMVFRKLI